MASDQTEGQNRQIDALTPRGSGHHFVVYGDACSGVPGAPHEQTFARTNAVISRLTPDPEFVIFAGDEVGGLTSDEAELREQWRYWLDVEMAWLDRSAVPLYNVTSNHTTYNAMSERVFAEMLDHLPRNIPPGAEGLSYVVRRGDLLLVFVHTSAWELGGEGHVETLWLDEVLTEHADAEYKFVIGHHPAFPVNGFSGEHQREVGAAGVPFWKLLTKHRVFAYLCSHILAFDVQVHDGILQLVTAGAGTAHRMPEGIEYLHFVQGAIDSQGLRYRVHDQEGVSREALAWPPSLPPSTTWERLATSEIASNIGSQFSEESRDAIMTAFRLGGTAAADASGQPQTLLATSPEGAALPSIWIGLTGTAPRLTVTVAPTRGRSPHYWFGPVLAPGELFDVQLALHTGMGPGGIMYRTGDESPWNSLTSSSPWGLERVPWPSSWTIGYTDGPAPSAHFRGAELSVSCAVETMPV